MENIFLLRPGRCCLKKMGDPILIFTVNATKKNIIVNTGKKANTKKSSKILLKNERDKTAQLLRQERTQKKINRELEKTNKLKRENLTLNNRAAAPSRPISRGRGTTVSTTGGGGGGGSFNNRSNSQTPRRIGCVSDPVEFPNSILA